VVCCLPEDYSSSARSRDVHFKLTNTGGVASQQFECQKQRKSSNKLTKFKQINIVSQNARSQIDIQNIFAVCLQETWRNSTSIELYNDCIFILHTKTLENLENV